MEKTQTRIVNWVLAAVMSTRNGHYYRGVISRMFAVILVTNVNITSLTIKLEKKRKQIWNADSLSIPVVSIIFECVDFEFFFSPTSLGRQ